MIESLLPWCRRRSDGLVVVLMPRTRVDCLVWNEPEAVLVFHLQQETNYAETEQFCRQMKKMNVECEVSELMVVIERSWLL